MPRRTAAATQTLRMMLVDDHPIVRRGVHDILVDAFPGSVIHEVGLGSEATALFPVHGWDLIVLDLTLPDASGLDVLKRVRETHARLPVLVLSMHAAEQFARRAIAAGASGYLTKDSVGAELISAVTRLLRGGRYFSRKVLEHVALGSGSGRKFPHETLSDREYQVLRMIAGGRKVTEIASALLVSVKTVSTYRARILEKMEMRTNAELIHYAVRHGLVE